MAISRGWILWFERGGWFRFFLSHLLFSSISYLVNGAIALVDTQIENFFSYYS